MIWLSWRLQRTETLVALGILVLLTAWLLPTGLDMWHAYNHDGLAGCLSTAGPDTACGGAVGLFRARFGGIDNLATWFNLVPGLIGVMLAVPLVSELENGTYRLGWTQSVTRRRWLLARLVLPIGAALLAAGGLIALFSWWRGPLGHIDGRLDNGTFDTTGVVMVGYTMFALGLALALGAVWRRTAASVGVSFAVYIGARLMVDSKLRDHLVSAVSATWKGRPPASFENAKVLSLVATIHGHRVLSGGGFTGGGVKLQAPNLNRAVIHAVYQPESHFWPLQLTETAMFCGVAVLLIVFAAWRVLRSD